MGITKQPEQYKTSDRRTFATEAEAERHQAVLDGMKAYDEAVKNLGRALMAEQKTADGQPWDLFRTYWYLDETWGSPVLMEIRFGRWYEQSLSVDDDGDLCIVAHDNHKQPRTYKAKELYALDYMLDLGAGYPLIHDSMGYKVAREAWERPHPGAALLERAKKLESAIRELVPFLGRIIAEAGMVCFSDSERQQVESIVEAMRDRA